MRRAASRAELTAGRCADIDALVIEIVNGTNNPAFDLTQDGVVDNADLTAWLAEAGAAELPSGNPYLLGDADLNGSVDGADFIVWNDSKFTGTVEWCNGNFNADAAVDGQDFIIWNDNKFQSADGVHGVPEPQTAILLLGSLLVWFSTGYRRG